MLNYYVLFLIFVFIGLFFLHRGGGQSKTNVPVVYGSMQCPHCVRLRGTIGPHEFVECSEQKCPDFVEAFPTTVYPDGTIKVGA